MTPDRQLRRPITVCSWREFIERKRAFLYFVIKMQTHFRRRGPMKYLAWLRRIRDQQPFRAVQIQRAWRRRKQNAVARKIIRMAALLTYKVSPLRR